MNYWDYRKIVSKIIPRRNQILFIERNKGIKEKGRKKNYKQFDIRTKEIKKIERLLDKENIQSFVEVSLRAQSCPMPLNIDTWDGLRCPYACVYCYADYFKHSLYTSFFDNSKSIGLRNCNPDKFKKELEKLFKHRGESLQGESDILNAIRLEIPMRVGIRFEDFTLAEKKKGITYELLKFLFDSNYPTMINTKSDLIGEDKYLNLMNESKIKPAIHVTLISSDENLLKKIEPGAPSFENRLNACKRLSDIGVRIIARIEPWMIFLNDEKNKVEEYIYKIKEAGIKHLTFDSYSYSAKGRGIIENFKLLGIDFDRMFLLSSDSQWLSSFLLGEFMKYFRQNDLKVSTFDQGNVMDNDDMICCSVDDWYPSCGFNWGCGVIAIRFIKMNKGRYTRWKDFEKFVNDKGGFLNSKLKLEVKKIWNGIGDAAWPIYWSKDLIPMGQDEDGIIWKYEKYDFRKYILENGGLI